MYFHAVYARKTCSCLQEKSTFRTELLHKIVLCLGPFQQIKKTSDFASERAVQHTMSQIRVAFLSAPNKIVVRDNFYSW